MGDKDGARIETTGDGRPEYFLLKGWIDEWSAKVLVEHYHEVWPSRVEYAYAEETSEDEDEELEEPKISLSSDPGPGRSPVTVCYFMTSKEHAGLEKAAQLIRYYLKLQNFPPNADLSLSDGGYVKGVIYTCEALEKIMLQRSQR